MKTIGTLSGDFMHTRPPCKWPGCRNGAVTTGRLPGGGFGNVCSTCKMKGDRLARRK